MAYNNDRARRNRDEEASEFTEKVVSLNRVSKTVKGGRVQKFSATARAVLVTVWAKQAKFPKQSARVWKTPKRILSTSPCTATPFLTK